MTDKIEVYFLWPDLVLPTHLIAIVNSMFIYPVQFYCLTEPCGCYNREKRERNVGNALSETSTWGGAFVPLQLHPGAHSLAGDGHAPSGRARGRWSCRLPPTESSADPVRPSAELPRLTWVQVRERAHHEVQCGHGQQEQQQQLQADDPLDTC